MHRAQLFVWTLFLLICEVQPAHCQDKKSQAGEKVQAVEQIPPVLNEFQGKRLEYWIKEIGSKDQSKSDFAIQVVLAFGPERAMQAVPAILDRVRVHSLGAPVDTSVLANGILALGALLGGNKEANHKDVVQAVLLMRRILNEANESIIKLRAAQVLTMLGPEAKDAVPELINLVNDKRTYQNRQAAVIALSHVAYDEKKGPSVAVLNALYNALADKSTAVRLSAIQSLTVLGSPANPSLHAVLIAKLDPIAYKDIEPGIRIWAHMAVMSIKHAVEKERVDAIAEQLGHGEAMARVQASQAIGTIGKDAKQTIPRLMKTLADPDPIVVAWSMWALGRMGPAAAAAVPTLQRIRADMTQPEVHRKMAEDAISQINGKKQ